jgi:two-component system chemotaxis response regulator CheB
MKKYSCIVIGGSAGAFGVITEIIRGLPATFQIPIIIAQHLNIDTDYYFIEHYRNSTSLNVELVDDFAQLKASTIYVCPADYHLLVEDKETLVLSSDEKVNFSRPSIDVLFESAADIFENEILSIILTGANNDGAYGSSCIKDRGGTTIAQQPSEAKFSEMPQKAIETNKIDHILTIDRIIEFLKAMIVED